MALPPQVPLPIFLPDNPIRQFLSIPTLCTIPPTATPLSRPHRKIKMGKLKDMVSEPVSLAERLKINAKRVRLAGIGLISKVDAERTRLYQQIVDLGESYGDEDSLVGRLSVLGTGTVHLVLEESQKLLDELVEAGELALAKESVRPLSRTGRINTPRPVGKPAPKLVSAAKSVPGKEPVKPVVATAPRKPALTEVAKTAPASAAAVTDELQQRFEAAKARLNTLTAPPDRKSTPL